MNHDNDERIVLTLDAGGTNFVFSAVQANREMVEPIRLPAETMVLDKSLETIRAGFRQTMEVLEERPTAISFAFPAPADYPNGIVDNHNNLPAFAGGIPLGPWLERQFGLPVFINNDADLFTFGEAIAGLLPHVNRMLRDAGSPKQYRNLFGITMGTGFGSGLVHDGRLYLGDNSNGSEIWLLRNKLRPECLAEDGANIRAIRTSYAEHAGISLGAAPSPKEIEDIALGKVEGCRCAAVEAYRELGEVVGDALANAITLVDGLVVMGGGISKGHRLFMTAVLNELNGRISTYSGDSFDRIVQRAYNLENPVHAEEFLKGETKNIPIPGSNETVAYDPLKRIGIGTTRLGTSKAVGIGAYAFALHQIDA
jgi:glucokinase